MDTIMTLSRRNHAPPNYYCRSSMVVLLILTLSFHQQLVSATKSSTLGAPITRLAFYPRGGGATSSVLSSSSSSSPSSYSATSTIFARRRRESPITSTPSSSSIQNVGLLQKKKSKKQQIDFDEDYDLDHYNPPHYNDNKNGEPTLEELRAQLGPIGILVSSTIELTVITVQSYITGGILGYIGGSVMAIPSTIFGKEMGSIVSRFGALHTKAVISFKSWSTLSAAFSGFNNFVRLCRGDASDNDGWNAIWGSALAGAFLNRSGGPQAMIQGGATYAGFTYVLEKFFSSPSTRQQKSQELVFDDVPLNDDW